MEEQNPKNRDIKNVGCSELFESLTAQRGRWFVAQYRTAKVVCSPKGSNYGICVIYSINWR